MRLDIGRGGLGKREGWTTVDIDREKDPDIVNAAQDLVDISDGSVDEIFSSHMIEHVEETEVVPMLKVWLRKLNAGGTLTVYVPDVEGPWRAYLSGDPDVPAERVLFAMIGADPIESKYQRHKTFFWPNRLKELVEQAGFSAVRTIPCREDRVMEFGLVAEKPK